MSSCYFQLCTGYFQVSSFIQSSRFWYIIYWENSHFSNVWIQSLFSAFSCWCSIIITDGLKFLQKLNWNCRVNRQALHKQQIVSQFHLSSSSGQVMGELEVCVPESRLVTFLNINNTTHLFMLYNSVIYQSCKCCLYL